MTYRETRRILLDGNIVDVVRHGDDAASPATAASVGRRRRAVHLPPVVPVQDRLRPPELLVAGRRR